jgi:hypothetical protein
MYQNGEGECVAYWYSLYEQLPVTRIATHPGTFGVGTLVYLMMGCDENDPNFILDQNLAFGQSLADAPEGSMKGAWLVESTGAHGHHFSEADCKLALQWITEAVVEGYDSRRATYNTSPRVSCWIRPDEATITTGNFGGFLSYAGLASKSFASCSSYVGAWNPAGSVEIVQSFMTSVVSAKFAEQKAEFDSMQNDPVYMAEYNDSKQQAANFLANM